MIRFPLALASAVASLALLAAASHSRDINDYPVCREIRAELSQMVPQYFTPAQVAESVERCMTWEDRNQSRVIDA